MVICSNPAPRAGSVGLCLLGLIAAVNAVAPPAVAAPAVAAPQGGSFQADVRFANRSSYPRREWGLATVPFPQGVWNPGDQFAVEGSPSTLQPFGARWPDGSARFAQLAVRLDLAPRSEQLVRVRKRPSNAGPFRFSPWVMSRSAGFGFTVLAGVNNRVVAAGLRPTAIVEDLASHRTVLFRERVPQTDLICDLWLTVFSDQDSVRFEMRLTNSRHGSQKWVQDLDFLAIVVDGAVPVFRSAYRSRIVQSRFRFDGSNIALLLGRTHFFDGQAHDWWGDLLFFDERVQLPDARARVEALAALFSQPLYGVALNWRSSMAFGPFGHVPDAPPWITDQGRQAALQDRVEFEQWQSQLGEPFEDRPMGLIKYASATGAQHDFGVAKLVGTFHSAIPDGVEEARHFAAEEAHRPVHHREADGRPVLAANHPDWVALGGRTHYHSGVSPDRLGKTTTPPRVTDFSHGWNGKDNQHWSSLTLASAYLLTKSHSLGMELDNEAEIYKASHTLPSLKPNWPTNGIGRARAVGRTLLTMSWVYLCTGRRDLRDWMVARVEQCVATQYDGLLTFGAVKPIDVVGPDPRVVPHPFWTPWAEAQAVLGLQAAAQVTGSIVAHQIAFLCVKNLMTFGWWTAENELRVGYGVAFLQGGRPLTPRERDDPSLAVWANSGFSVWSLPATKLAVVFGAMYGDLDLLNRSLPILLHIQGLRHPPRDNPLGWDDYAGWDAVW